LLRRGKKEGRGITGYISKTASQRDETGRLLSVVGFCCRIGGRKGGEGGRRKNDQDGGVWLLHQYDTERTQHKDYRKAANGPEQIKKGGGITARKKAGREGKGVNIAELFGEKRGIRNERSRP